MSPDAISEADGDDGDDDGSAGDGNDRKAADAYADFTCAFQSQDILRVQSNLKCPVHGGNPEDEGARANAIEMCESCCAFLPCRTLAEKEGTPAPTHEEDDAVEDQVLTQLDCRVPNVLIARRRSAEHLRLQRKRCVAQLRPGCSLSLRVLQNVDRTSRAGTCASWPSSRS